MTQQDTQIWYGYLRQYFSTKVDTVVPTKTYFPLLSSTDPIRTYLPMYTETGEQILASFFGSWGGVRLSPLVTSATNWRIVPTPDGDRC
jgi:hypothetical protein